MKFKNIYSAIHNFGQSFLSLMNHVDDTYIVDELNNIIARGHDIEIDWLNKTLIPEKEISASVRKSLDYYYADLPRHLRSQNVDIKKMALLKLFIPVRGRSYMLAMDVRGKEYKIYLS